MKRYFTRALLFTVLLVHCSLALMAQIDPIVRPFNKIKYDTEYSAEELLNGTLARRKPSPPALISYDTTGFAKDRLYHVPSAGIHPRIFFGPQDIPVINRHIHETESGRQMLSYIREQLARGIDHPGTWENTLFNALEKGDFEEFKRVYRDETKNDRLVPGNDGPLNPLNLTATKWHHRDAFTTSLMLKSLICLLDDDAQRGKPLGKVIANYARYLEPQIDRESQTMFGDSWWRSIRNVVTEHPYLAYAYDWDFNFMTPADAAEIRKVLSKITKGKTTLGFELPAHWRNWNYMDISMYFPLYALAIEGEEGYDPRIYQRSKEVIRDYLTYSINPGSGMAHEGIGYHTAGLTHIEMTMLAMANRGDNMFTIINFKQQFSKWMTNMLQPYGQTWFSDGDLGNFAPNLESVMVAKYFFPHDPGIDFVYQNIPEVKAANFKKDFFMDILLPCCADPDKTKNGDLVDYHYGRDLGLPVSYSDEKRGVTVSRSDWTANALYLNYSSHPDITFAAHEHAGHGRFVVSGLGRVWAWETSRPHDTQDHSCITIDGQGQGFFSPPTKWLGTVDKPLATFAGSDDKYAYDWRWEKEIGMWDSTDIRLNNRFYAWAKSNVKKMDHSLAQYDPSEVAVNYYNGYLDGNPRMWDEDSWVVRLPHNPVKKAFRSAGLVRGKHPYVMIVDDIQKDDQVHDYSWNMQVPTDVILLSKEIGEGCINIILGEKNGGRRLLIRFVEINCGSDKPSVDLQHFSSKYQLAGQGVTTVQNDRLVINTKTKSPEFKVLIYPFTGQEELPVTQWDKSGRSLAIEWKDQKDAVSFLNLANGRTSLKLQRSGKLILKY